MTEIPVSKILRKHAALKMICQIIPAAEMVSQLVLAGTLLQPDVDSSFYGKNGIEQIDALLILLEKADKAGRIPLMLYEWVVLPELKIKLTIWTQAGIKEYEYV